MSQHDFNITQADADAGVDYRAAVNAALQALGSNSSGPTAPVATYAYQLWADTTKKILKQRDATNSYWISLWPLSGAVTKKFVGSSDSPYTAPSTILFMQVYCTTTNIDIYLPPISSLNSDQRIVIQRIDSDVTRTVTLHAYDPGGGGLFDVFYDEGSTKLITTSSIVEIMGSWKENWITI